MFRTAARMFKEGFEYDAVIPYLMKQGMSYADAADFCIAWNQREIEIVHASTALTREYNELMVQSIAQNKRLIGSLEENIRLINKINSMNGNLDGD